MLRKVVFAACVFWCATTFAVDSHLSARNTYTAAEKALRQNQLTQYESLKQRLQATNYVLLPFLEYAEIQKAFASGQFPTDKVHAFLSQEQNTALGDRLRTSWLYHLAKHQQWDQFAQDYQTNKDVGLQCYDIYARYKLTGASSVLNEALPLWLYGKSQPDPCNTVFQAWRTKGGLTEKLVWDRVYLAMEANQYVVVNYLMRHVPAEKQRWVQTWLNTYRDPNIISSEKLFRENVPFLRDTQVYGIQRIAKKDPEKAANLWIKLDNKYKFSEAQRNHAYRAIAVSMAMDHNPDAMWWFKKIPLSYYNNAAYEWHVRAALRQGAWKEVAFLIPDFPEKLRRDSSWTYWLARAYDELGRGAEAQALYSALSQERSFAGVMASERLGVDYSINLPQIELTQDDMKDALNNVGIARALELHEMERITHARREWMETTAKLNEKQLQAAAIIAFERGWQERAILTLARAENQNNIAVRFPVLYQKTVEREAKRNGLNPAWVYAIARRESAFVADAKSPVGATGLMQLMPYTAKQIARKLNEPFHTTAQLTNPPLNIRLGSAYLKQIYKDFDENMILATAAYNAGPSRVKQWLPKNDRIEADIWIETIPFYETREYVKAVLVYRLIYQHHLKMDDRLGSVLDDIEA